MSRKLIVLALAAILGFTWLSAPASAAGEVSMSATITSTDAVAQNGSVCLEVVGSGSCGGTNFTNGAWSRLQAPGDYLVQVRSTTMDETVRWYQEGNSAGAVNKVDATPVHLVGGDPEFHFDMVMPAIAKVTGTVLDNHGAPAADTNVSRTLGNTKSTTTDSNGHYNFGYVRAGTYTLNVAAHGENAGTSGSMTVPASGDYVVPDLIVQHAASIHGTVTDEVTANPVPLVYVEVFTAGTHQYQGSAYTDLNGEYRIPQLGNQPLVARFTDEYGGYVRKLYGGGDPSTWAGEVSFTLAAEEDKLVAAALTPKALDPAPTHTLSGQVTGPGGVPLPGIQVSSNGEYYDETDRDGRWYLDGPIGSNLLKFEDASRWGTYIFGDQPGWFPEYYPDASTTAASTPVTVTAGPAQENLDVELTRGAFVRGTVLDSGDVPTGFVPAWQAYRDDGGLDVEQSFTGGPGYTAFVRPGIWRLVVRAQRNVVGSPQTYYLPRWYGDVDSFAAAAPVTVTAGEVLTGKDVHLSTAFDQVSAPVVTGVRAAGKTLTASPGAWSTMTLTQFTTTWWRGATQVGSGSSYLVKPADAGGSLRARVVAVNGAANGTAYSAWTGIAKLVSSATLRGTSPRARTARLAITVRAAGLTPTGTVVIRRGTTIVRRVVLSGGRAVVVLPRQPKGVQRYQASYLGSAQVAPDASAVLRLRVR